MTDLRISVVVPTHNRRERLMQTLAALERQDIGAAAFEVIVVIDHGTDDTVPALEARQWPFNLRHLPSRARGAAAARNTGAAVARGERLVFLDDDIEVEPGFLAAHLAEGTAAGEGVVVGHSTPAGLGRDWFGQSVVAWWNGRFGAMAAPGYRFGHTDVMSGNLSVGREVFARLGGFDEALQCREDYEFGYRLVQADVPVRYASAARGRHYDASTPRRNLERAAAEGRADLQIARKHPALFAWLRSANMSAPTRSAGVLRVLAFRLPGLSRGVLRAGLNVQRACEIMGLRRQWTWLNGHLRALAYQTGVAAEAGSVAALLALRDGSRGAAVATPVDLDLADGRDANRARVSEARPEALAVFRDGRLVDGLSADPGRERIGVRHLDAMLDDLERDQALRTEAEALLPPVPATAPEWVSAPRRLTQGAVHLAELDLALWGLSSLEPQPSFPVRILVRVGRVPIGWVRSDAPTDPEAFWRGLRLQVLDDRAACARLVRLARLPEPEFARPPVSVVVCTRDRTETLRRCLAALRGQDYPDYEIVVIDNAPTTDATRTLVAEMPDVRYVREDRPGLDWARNRGVAEARHGIVAFTDDDTWADRHWLTGIAAAFADRAVEFVTGLVAPMKLDTPARLYFEDIYGGMGKGLDPVCRRPGELAPHDLLWASALGVGANMAFRKEVFATAGPFDPALDVGTATRGGGDIEMFHRALARGCGHCYQPAALVWHEHRSDFDGLRRQLADNGSGFAAYLLAAWRNRTVSRMAVLRFAGRAWMVEWLALRWLRPRRHRRDFVAAEIGGMLRGPRVWREAQAAAQALARQVKDAE